MNRSIDNKQIKVFVSSTFSDLQEERKSLTYKIFPAKRFLCENKGYDFIDIDLRWGVSAREAESGDVLEICLTEIDNTKPFFIGIIGDRYGWIPVRNDINDIDTFIKQYPKIDTYLNLKYSITEMEMMYGVLDSDRDYDAVFFMRESLLQNNSPEDRKLNKLREKIKTQNKYPVFEYRTIEEFENAVDTYLTRRLDEICIKNQSTESEYEKLHHQFTSKLLRNYLPFERQIKILDEFVSDPARSLIKLVGEIGCGKSSVMAYYACLVNSRQGEWQAISYHHEAMPPKNTIYSNDDRDVIIYLRYLLAKIFGGPSPQINRQISTVQDDEDLLCEYLSEVTKRGIKILVLLDLSEWMEWEWYLKNFIKSGRENPNVKFVLAHEKSKHENYLSIAQTIIRNKENYLFENAFFDLEPEYKLGFVEHYFKYYSKRLPYPQLVNDIAQSDIKTPLSLVLLLENLRKYGDYDTFSAHLAELLDKTPRAFIHYLIDDMAREFDTDDCAFVHDFFCYLAVDQFFTESDIVAVLGIPHEKLYVFYRFFRACAPFYRIVDKYLLLNVNSIDVLQAPDNSFNEDSLEYGWSWGWDNTTEKRYKRKVIDYFVNNFDKHTKTARMHMFAADNRTLKPYYIYYREKAVDNTLEDNELATCQCLLISYDLRDGDEYSQNKYMAMKCLDRMSRTGVDIADNEQYIRDIQYWLKDFYHAFDREELNRLYCTDEELARPHQTNDEFEYDKVTRRLCTFLKNHD